MYSIIIFTFAAIINNRKELIENEVQLFESYRKGNKEILTHYLYDMSNMMSRNEGVCKVSDHMKPCNIEQSERYNRWNAEYICLAESAHLVCAY